MEHHKGIHHITVLAGDPLENARFYVQKLGMRLIKKSVNQDDPGTYHLFYGNEAAQPGSSLTFFPWPRAHKGETGTGEAVNVAFQVPEHSMDFWSKRLAEMGIQCSEPFEIFGKTAIRFSDPDGLELDLVFDGEAKEKQSRYKSTVPHEYSIQGFWSTRLRLASGKQTTGILTNILGFNESCSKDNYTLFESDANIGNRLIIEETGTEEYGKGGRGIIHHVAFRAKDREELETMRKQVAELGLNPTQLIDRHWFRSVYYREPAGVLFEMASDDPGYTVDEDFEALGEKLILPPWLEPRRNVIEEMLPEINLNKL